MPYHVTPDIKTPRPFLATSTNPSHMKSFHIYEILTYVLSWYQIKYPKVVPSLVQLISALWDSLSHSLWRLIHKLRPTTNTNKKTSHYLIFFQYLFLIYYVLNISKRGRNFTQYLVPVPADSVASLPNSYSVLSFTSHVKSNFKLKIDNQK